MVPNSTCNRLLRLKKWTCCKVAVVSQLIPLPWSRALWLLYQMPENERETKKEERNEDKRSLSPVFPELCLISRSWPRSVFN